MKRRKPPFHGRMRRAKPPFRGFSPSELPCRGIETGVFMLGLGKWLNGTPGKTAVVQPGNGAGNGVAFGPDVVAGFPRGLPDGNLHKPLGTARWPSEAETLAVLGPWEPGRFLLGRDSAGRYIGHHDDRHILSVSGSRAGKGISLICPALLTWPHSAICIDPKGELATITASRRGKGSKWADPMPGGW
jgi:hypothetical protein